MLIIMFLIGTGVIACTIIKSYNLYQHNGQLVIAPLLCLHHESHLRLWQAILLPYFHLEAHRVPDGP